MVRVVSDAHTKYLKTFEDLLQNDMASFESLKKTYTFTYTHTEKSQNCTQIQTQSAIYVHGELLPCRVTE